MTSNLSRARPLRRRVPRRRARLRRRHAVHGALHGRGGRLHAHAARRARARGVRDAGRRHGAAGAAARALPRAAASACRGPGAWMETFKQVLAFPLYATVAWLTWVLGAQAGNDAVLGAPRGPGADRDGARGCTAAGSTRRAVARRGRAASSPSPASLVAWPGPRGGRRAPRRSRRARASCRGRSGRRRRWRELTAQGKAVFVDFTAAWCVTCQVNKRVALNNAAVVEAFAPRDVVAAARRLDAPATRASPRRSRRSAATPSRSTRSTFPGEDAAAPAARSPHAHRSCSTKSRGCPRPSRRTAITQR